MGRKGRGEEGLKGREGLGKGGEGGKEGLKGEGSGLRGSGRVKGERQCGLW